MDENCSGVLIFCLFVQKTEAKLDPITDIFRTMHVTAFGLHRLEATAPWGVEQENQTEEKVTPSDKKMSPTDLAHFAMLSRGNCWLSVEGIAEPIPLTSGDCFLLAKGTSIVLRDSLRTRPRWSFREIGEGQRQCRSLWRRRRTDDNRLWILEFRSRQPEVDHSVIAELHFDEGRSGTHACSSHHSAGARVRDGRTGAGDLKLSRVGWPRFCLSRYSGAYRVGTETQ